MGLSDLILTIAIYWKSYVLDPISSLPFYRHLLSAYESLQIDYGDATPPPNPTTTPIHPHLKFANASHVFIRQGRSINLTCTIKSVDAYEEVTWYHNETLIAPNQSQWVSIKRICSPTDRKKCLIETTFSLVIEAAKSEQQGTYRCEANGTQPAEIFVEIVGGMYFVAVHLLSLPRATLHFQFIFH